MKNLLPKYGIFSPYTIMLHQNATGEHPKDFIKKALILFDKLLLIPSGLGDIGATNAIITKEEYLSHIDINHPFCSSKEFQKMFLLDRDFFQDTEKLHKEIHYNKEDDLWMGPQGDIYVDWVRQYVDKVSDKDISAGDKLEMEKMFIGNISYDYKMLSYTMKLSNDFSGLFSELHEQALRATLNSGIKANDKVIKSTGNINYFDFANLSWESIIELRNSEFTKNFRIKIIELAEKYSNEDNPDQFSNDLTDYIEDSKFDFIGKKIPKTRQSILTGIGSNLPSPILINPIGVASSISDINKNKKIKNEFGWLIFIQKTRKMVKMST